MITLQYGFGLGCILIISLLWNAMGILEQWLFTAGRFPHPVLVMVLLNAYYLLYALYFFIFPAELQKVLRGKLWYLRFRIRVEAEQSEGGPVQDELQHGYLSTNGTRVGPQHPDLTPPSSTFLEDVKEEEVGGNYFDGSGPTHLLANKPLAAPGNNFSPQNANRPAARTAGAVEDFWRPAALSDEERAFEALEEPPQRVVYSQNDHGNAEELSSESDDEDEVVLSSDEDEILSEVQVVEDLDFSPAGIVDAVEKRRASLDALAPRSPTVSKGAAIYRERSFDLGGNEILTGGKNLQAGETHRASRRSSKPRTNQTGVPKLDRLEVDGLQRARTTNQDAAYLKRERRKGGVVGTYSNAGLLGSFRSNAEYLRGIKPKMTQRHAEMLVRTLAQNLDNYPLSSKTTQMLHNVLSAAGMTSTSTGAGTATGGGAATAARTAKALRWQEQNQNASTTTPLHQRNKPFFSDKPFTLGSALKNINPDENNVNKNSSTYQPPTLPDGGEPGVLKDSNSLLNKNHMSAASLASTTTGGGTATMDSTVQLTSLTLSPPTLAARPASPPGGATGRGVPEHPIGIQDNMTETDRHQLPEDDSRTIFGLHTTKNPNSPQPKQPTRPALQLPQQNVPLLEEPLLQPSKSRSAEINNEMNINTLRSNSNTFQLAFDPISMSMRRPPGVSARIRDPTWDLSLDESDPSGSTYSLRIPVQLEPETLALLQQELKQRGNSVFDPRNSLSVGIGGSVEEDEDSQGNWSKRIPELDTLVTVSPGEMIELVEVTPGTKFPLWETLLRPLGIGLLFMGATFLDMLAMQFTTLSSATLVGRVNSVTIYIASIFFLGEPSVPAKWLGVALCLSGCVLVLHLDAVSAAESGGSGGESRATSSSSTSDGTTGSSSTPGTSASNPASSSNAVLQKEYPYALYGDLAALFAVIFYTAYAITLKRFVKTTADTMWTLTLTGCFFTFLGIPGYYFFAPEFITGAYASALIEAFTIPYLVASFMFLGVIGGAGSNYLWVRSCQIVGPTMLAVGLNISIPISMLWDRFGRGFVEATSPLKLFAASLVVVGFLLVIYIDTLINEEEGKQEDQEDERAMDEADLRADINAASEQQPGPRLPGTIPSRNSTFEQLRSRTSIGVQDDAVALVLPSFPANPLLSPRAGRDGTTDHHVQGGKRTEGEMENGDKMMQQESCLGFFAGALLPLDWNRRDLVRWLLTPYYPPLPSFLSGSTASFDALAAETRKANTMKSSKPSSAPAPKKNKKWRALKNLGGQAVRNAVPNCAYCIMLILPQTIDYVLVGIMATPDTRTYALGGIALGISLINVFGIAPGIGFNQALDTLVSVAFGAKKHTKIFHYVAQAQLLIVCYMPVIILSCGICASNIFDTFATHTDPNVAAQAVEFLHSQFLFVPLFLFSDIVRKFFANVRELHHIQPYQMAAICLHGVWVYLCIEFISGRDHAAMGAGLGTSFTWLLFFLGYHLVFHKWFRTFRETTNARVLGINGPAVQPRGQQPANYTVNKKASPRGGYHSATTTSMSNNDKSSSKQEEEPVEQEHIFFLSNLSDPAVYSGHALYSYGELAVRSSANVLTEWVAREILTVLISQVSASAIAVHAAIDGTYSQLYMIPLGIAGSTATLVGSSLGMRKPVQAGRFAYVSLTLGLVAWSLMFVLLFGVPPYRWLPPPFARDADTVPHETLLHTGLQLKIADVFFPAEHNAKALFERWLFRRILIFAFAVTFWCDMGENILQGVLRACGQQQIAALVYVCQHYLLGLPVAVFLAFSTVGHGITEALVSHCNLLFLDTSVLTDGDFFAHANTMEKTSVLGLYGLWFGFSLGVVSGFVVFVYYLCVKINFRKEVKTALRRLVWHSRAAAVRGKTTDRKLSGATAKV